jgi:putative flippase GtrA
VGLQVSFGRWRHIIRYYQAGVINTVFGLGMYAVLIRLGAGIYAAQLLSHLLGMAFNYVTYSRHVFSDTKPGKMMFIVSYGVNYLISLTIITLLAKVIVSRYIVGFATAVIASLVNYFILKRFVFRAAVT